MLFAMIIVVVVLGGTYLKAVEIVTASWPMTLGVSWAMGVVLATVIIGIFSRGKD
jgi:hypothetical protein